MSLIAQVTATTGASRDDVLRVATHGGTSQADWAIAHAIENAGGRSAYELMLTAGRAQEIATIWADSRDHTDQTTTDTPRLATGVTVYTEDAAELVTDTPQSHPTLDDNEAQEDEEFEALWARAWAAVANITSATKEIVDRIVGKWQTPNAVHAGFTNLMRAARRPWAARLRETYMTAA
ncbi:hypothetical protein ACIQFP_26685 [Nocardiopsis alba]|uniref:hypothetical protein n=1 Tax=Nocardiopsis alba TaxID=53437 RepID=UPI0037FC166B